MRNDLQYQGQKRERPQDRSACTTIRFLEEKKNPYGFLRLIAWLHMWKTDKAITTVFMFEE